MNILSQLKEKRVWERFYRYKEEHFASRTVLAELRGFIDREEYLPVCERMDFGEAFPLPVRSVINKMNTKKRRVVYTYPPAENTVLKLLTWLLLRRYDDRFEENLWSFRPGRGAKDAVRELVRFPGIGEMYSYKADISNYFNSVDVDLLLPMLEELTVENPELYAFLRRLLIEDRVMDRGDVITEPKGIMAGTPLASFYANLYLAELDRYFSERGILYARYSDDLILFARTEEEREEHIRFIRRFLEDRHLRLNPDKEVCTEPGERWEFLGFSYQNGTVDIAEVSGRKLRAKMRRKTRALRRWQMRKGLSGEKAAKAFIRAFNRKLFEQTEDHDLTWARWYFPVISTTDSLKKIDRYAQDCIRYLMSGTRTKGRFRIRYEDIRTLGYRNLVHEYYQGRENMV